MEVEFALYKPIIRIYEKCVATSIYSVHCKQITQKQKDKFFSFNRFVHFIVFKDYLTTHRRVLKVYFDEVQEAVG